MERGSSESGCGLLAQRGTAQLVLERTTLSAAALALLAARVIRGHHWAQVLFGLPVLLPSCCHTSDAIRRSPPRWRCCSLRRR